MKRKVKSILAVSFSLAAAATLAVGLAACGEQEEPPAGNTHEHVFEWVDASFATCTQKGSKKQVCTVCGAEGETRETDLVAHTPGAAQQKGDKHSYTCTVCGTVFGEEPHTYEWQAVIPATHTSRGTEKEVCSVCKAESGQTRVSDFAHTPGEWQVEGGKHYRVCTGCDAVIDDDYHDFGVGDTCLACGARDFYLKADNRLSYQDAEDGDGVIINEYFESYGDEPVENLRIPATLDGEKVVGIGDNVFQGHKELKSVYIPDGVESIGQSCFQNCNNLEEIRLPKTLKTIGGLAFSFTAVSDFRLYEGLTSIGKSAFSSTEITTMTLPSTVLPSESNLFMWCDKLKGVIFNDNWEYLYGNTEPYQTNAGNNGMFRECTSLEWMVIGKGIKFLGAYAFLGCDAFQRVYYNGTPEEFESLEIEGFREGNETVASAPIYYNDGTKDVGRWWYNEQGEIEYNEYPATDFTFYHYALNDPWTLSGYTGNSSRITLPTEYYGLPFFQIDDDAFKDRTDLRSVTIPEGYENIGDDAFNGSGITSIHIPDSVTRLEAVANNLHSEPGAWVYPSTYIFQNCESLAKVTGMKNITAFPSGTFYNCNRLSSLDIPAGLKSIGVSCFYNCVSLTSIPLPEGLESYEYASFQNCTGIEKFVLPSTSVVNSINCKQLFRGCTSLKQVIYLGDITSLPLNCFDNCPALESLVLAPMITWHTNPFGSNTQTLKAVYYRGTAEEWVAQRDKNIANFGTMPKPIKDAPAYYFSATPQKGAWHFTDESKTEVALWTDAEVSSAANTSAAVRNMGYEALVDRKQNEIS